MTSLHRLFAALLASTTLMACGIFKKQADSNSPTVDQQDAYDVSWGLPPRKSRGNPKLKYQYNARDAYPAAAAPLAPTPAPTSAPAPTPAPSPAPINPAVPLNLR